MSADQADELTEEEAIKLAAAVIRRWEHDGHWTAEPEAREILSIFRRLKQNK